jgi:spermidine/putrescine transport system permease protein
MSVVAARPQRKSTAREVARELVTNPWGKARFLWVIGIGYVLWSLVPIVLAILVSFNPGRSISAFQGFSWRWYFGDPAESVWHSPELRQSVIQSLKLAFGTVVLAVPIGFAFAVGSARWRGRGSATSDFILMFSFVTPELLIAVALFLLFANSFTFVGLGTPAQLLGMVVTSLAFVVIIVRARLLSLGRGYEEAAMDLGATPWQAVRRVLFPLLLPATLASAALIFASTLDDFVLANALSRDVSTETVAIKIWAARGSPAPVVNALGTLMLLISTIVIVVMIFVFRRMTRGETREQRGNVPLA